MEAIRKSQKGTNNKESKELPQSPPTGDSSNGKFMKFAQYHKDVIEFLDKESISYKAPESEENGEFAFRDINDQNFSNSIKFITRGYKKVKAYGHPNTSLKTNSKVFGSSNPENKPKRK